MGQYVSQAARAPAAFRRRTPVYPKRSNRTNDKDPLAPPATPSSDLGFSHWKIPDRSHLVVFPFLAGEIFVYRIWTVFDQDGPAARYYLQRGLGRKHLRRMAPSKAHQSWLDTQPCPEDRYVGLCAGCGSCGHGHMCASLLAG